MNDAVSPGRHAAARPRWARWAPRLALVVLAADCTGGGPPKPKAEAQQAVSAVVPVFAASKAHTESGRAFART